ncbi:MAG: ferritin-like domain-containing protein [Actinomycetota bacterium]|nr:ferritin-like domain-containing protein [Actinomycetota bacterium]
MASLEEQLVKYLTDAHALEQNVARQLDTMIQTTEDAELKSHFEHHKLETERHKTALEQRLEAHGASPSAVKQAGQVVAAMGAGAADIARKDNAGKNARDAFISEHTEIAAYELLERVANFAGDAQTVEVARRNRADEEAMAKKIADSWDRVALLSLQDEGVDIAEIAGRIPGGNAA